MSTAARKECGGSKRAKKGRHLDYDTTAGWLTVFVDGTDINVAVQSTRCRVPLADTNTPAYRSGDDEIIGCSGAATDNM